MSSRWRVARGLLCLAVALPIATAGPAAAVGSSVAPHGAATATIPADPVHMHLTKKRIERAASRLGLPLDRADGRINDTSRRAYCAWRELTGRTPNRNLLTPSQKYALVTTTRADLRPRRKQVVGVNINKTCQTATWIVRDKAGKRVVRAVFAVSTGTGGYDTPAGTFTIDRELNGWHESTLYEGAMMYRPKYFYGGIALHGSASDSLVLPYPASHGCVRMFHRDIDRLWSAGVSVGTRVRVYGAWRG